LKGNQGFDFVGFVEKWGGQISSTGIKKQRVGAKVKVAVRQAKVAVCQAKVAVRQEGEGEGEDEGEVKVEITGTRARRQSKDSCLICPRTMNRAKCACLRYVFVCSSVYT
jgi:hypothetical protein